MGEPKIVIPSIPDPLPQWLQDALDAPVPMHAWKRTLPTAKPPPPMRYRCVDCTGPTWAIQAVFRAEVGAFARQHAVPLIWSSATLEER